MGFMYVILFIMNDMTRCQMLAFYMKIPVVQHMYFAQVYCLIMTCFL